MQKIKLTERQKEILKLMREGWKLKTYFRPVQHRITTSDFREEQQVSKSSIEKLRGMQLIEYCGQNHWEFDYSLTDLGRTINLD